MNGLPSFSSKQSYPQGNPSTFLQLSSWKEREAYHEFTCHPSFTSKGSAYASSPTSISWFSFSRYLFQKPAQVLSKEGSWIPDWHETLPSLFADHNFRTTNFFIWRFFDVLSSSWFFMTGCRAFYSRVITSSVMLVIVHYFTLVCFVFPVAQLFPDNNNMIHRGNKSVRRCVSLPELFLLIVFLSLSTSFVSFAFFFTPFNVVFLLRCVHQIHIQSVLFLLLFLHGCFYWNDDNKKWLFLCEMRRRHARHEMR